MARCTIGLVGCGRWGRLILRDLNELGCEVVVVARSEASRRRASDAGAASLVTAVEELPHVDAVVVATPSTTHAEVIEQVIDREVPIFVEKPLATDLDDAERCARLAPDRLFVMDKWRYHPGVERLAQFARQEVLGPIDGLRTRRLGWGNPHPDTDGVWILAPHDLSIAQEILGAIPPVHGAYGHRHDETPSGLIGVLGDDPWMTLEISTLHPGHRREIELVCRDGVAVLRDGYADRIEIYRHGAAEPETLGEPELEPIASDMPLLKELRAFVEHLEGGPPPRSSAAEAVDVVRTLVELRSLAGLDLQECLP